MSEKHPDIVVNLARLAQDYRGPVSERLKDAIAEIERLRAALRLVIAECEFLHHEKEHQHHPIGSCPVVKIVQDAAMGGDDE